VPEVEWLAQAGLEGLADVSRKTGFGRQLTPLRTGTDGFFIAVLRRST